MRTTPAPRRPSPLPAEHRAGAALLAGAAIPDVLVAFAASIVALYYAWFVAMVPLALLRLATTALAVNLALPGRGRRGWRAAWAMELVHSLGLLFLARAVLLDSYRHSGFDSDALLALMLGWPLAAAAASVWALARSPRAAAPNPEAAAV